MKQMPSLAVSTFLTMGLVAGCSAGAANPAGADSGNSSGSSSSGGSSGSAGSGASSSSSSSGAGSSNGSGASSGGSGGSDDSGSDASATDDASSGSSSGGDDGSSSSGTDDGGSDGSTSLGGNILGWFEAEAVPPNTLLPPAVTGACGMATPACGAPPTIMPGAECCSGMGPHGGEVHQLLRGRGGLVFNQVSAPSDGMYDVTWWYHCGLNDNFGDPNCGGEPHTPSGCRPAGLTVNGTMMPHIYQFPCFPGDWGQIHAYTTPLTLKAGPNNSIQITAGIMGRDAADIDAIAVMPLGMGVAPRYGGGGGGPTDAGGD